MLRPFHWSPSRAARSLVGVAGQCSRPRPSHWAHVSQRSPGGGASRQSGLAGAAATDRGPDDSAGSSDSEPLRLKLRRATLADAEQLAALCTEVRDASQPPLLPTQRQPASRLGCHSAANPPRVLRPLLQAFPAAGLPYALAWGLLRAFFLPRSAPEWRLQASLGSLRLPACLGWGPGCIAMQRPDTSLYSA